MKLLNLCILKNAMAIQNKLCNSIQDVFQKARGSDAK